ncbi:hypothetical protein [Actinomadura harenae]|uniref:Secreted protein n=1 Tax=Actinomadura harenae TaxID=2483351 RepID=A0A3M2M668_9ACTN|nr:hypothetical protein [Actinomadura harenae]RMI44480.1 hypothetical protein EBO15_12595 [Actinomadura harenae]
MKLTYLALAAGVAAVPLIAAPAQAAAGPWFHHPTYDCQSLYTTRDFPSNAIGERCVATPEAPTTGIIDHGVTVKSVTGEKIHCHYIDLEGFPNRVFASRCEHEPWW